MAIDGLEKIVGGHALFAGLGDAFLSTVSGCAKNVRFAAGDYLFHEGDDAAALYLIREGHVGLEIAAAGHGRMTFQSAGPQSVVGLSWLVPPYRWTYDARAVKDVRAIALDATCLRRKCDADPALGYEVMKRFMPTIVERLHNTRLQMLDVYGTPS
ncbi:cyclic nucleotide-binding domain-containing protein [Aliiroseovarius subalbicans]|uniref:cyclic nucleotide-binding domain-containing protein n=1 Tax=Aliiroseovarius subalbicans TaxID=2925840 RepID=UPI001F570879|nr:cyclic nucleotide-binding domain-containing protein [Aliiroseovarius subalbicans]MCI2397807.1 cyclic nucleotide-binding domain-containing protein [Aliiroseovarius subalbicans]